MQSEPLPGAPRVALIVEVPPAKDHLHAALREAAIPVASECRAGTLDPLALAGADVILVSLDEAMEPHLERVTKVVAGMRLPVVFDDCRVSRTLSGVERNRWARHLFAKLTGSNDTRPPVPVRPSSLRTEGTAPERSISHQGPVWVLCASIGSPESVRRFLEGLLTSSGAAFILVQHMGADFQHAFVERLRRVTSLEVCIAVNDARPGCGKLIVVPVDHGFRIDDAGCMRLETLHDAQASAPNIDQVLLELVSYYGAQVNAIIFSGKTQEGIEGCHAIKRKGGKVLAQDSASAVVSATAHAVREAGLVDFSGSPEELAQYVERV